MGGEEEGIGKWGRIPQHIDHRGPVRKMNMNSAFVLYRITYSMSQKKVNGSNLT